MPRRIRQRAVDAVRRWVERAVFGPLEARVARVVRSEVDRVVRGRGVPRAAGPARGGRTGGRADVGALRAGDDVHRAGVPRPRQHPGVRAGDRAPGRDGAGVRGLRRAVADGDRRGAQGARGLRLRLLPGAPGALSPARPAGCLRPGPAARGRGRRAGDRLVRGHPALVPGGPSGSGRLPARRRRPLLIRRHRADPRRAAAAGGLGGHLRRVLQLARLGGRRRVPRLPGVPGTHRQRRSSTRHTRPTTSRSSSASRSRAAQHRGEAPAPGGWTGRYVVSWTTARAPPKPRHARSIRRPPRAGPAAPCAAGRPRPLERHDRQHWHPHCT